MTGQGGWPLNMFLTPEGVPFYVGTYFPPEPRHGLPSWQMVLRGVADAWEHRRDGDPRAERSDRAIAPGDRSDPALAEPIQDDLLEQAVDGPARLLRRAQRRLGRRAEVPCGVDNRVPAGPRRARDDPRDPARDGERRHLRPGRRRLLPVRSRRDLDRPALREDAVRQRAAGTGLPPRVAGVR